VLTWTVTGGGLVGTDNFTGALARDAGENIGFYDITQGTLAINDGNGGNNYTLTSVDGELEITPKSLTIAANDRSKTYGDTVTFAGTEFTIAGLVNADTITSVTLTSAGAAATAGAGNHAIVPSAATGTGVENYEITYVDGTLTVNPKAITIAASDRTKTYGTAVTFAGTEFTATGLVNADTVTSVTLTSAGTAASAAPVGSPYSIVSSAAAGTGLGNYAISYVNGALTVNKSSTGCSVTSSTATSKHGKPVTFQDGGTVLGSSTLNNGTATYSTADLAAGSHFITAVYSGDANFAGSTSTPITHAVKKPAGVNWGLIIGLILAGIMVSLFFFLIFFARRRKKDEQEQKT